MDQVYLREQLKKHKDFLQKLQSGQNVGKVLSQSSDSELNAVLRLLHLIGDGHIAIKGLHRDTIKKTKREAKLVSIGSKVNFHQLMKQSREAKIKFAKHFKSLYAILFHSLFHV